MEMNGYYGQSQDRDYCLNLLRPLFDSTYRNTVDSLFEYVCRLVRPTGIQMEVWDPLLESTELVTDLAALSRMDLAGDEFPNPDRTRANCIHFVLPPDGGRFLL